GEGGGPDDEQAGRRGRAQDRSEQHATVGVGEELDADLLRPGSGDQRLPVLGVQGGEVVHALVAEVAATDARTAQLELGDDGARGRQGELHGTSGRPCNAPGRPDLQRPAKVAAGGNMLRYAIAL